MQGELIVFYGGEVKALDGGKVGGYLVRFSTPETPDLEGDYFDASTRFGDHATTPVLYQHGMDTKMAKRIIGRGELRTDEVGVWIEAQLELRDEYEKAIYDLAKQGKLGWSSGTASHLVERELVGKSYHITQWPLGLDASLTPMPAEPRNTAIPLKSLLPAEGEPEAASAAASEAVAETQPNPHKETTMDENLKTEIVELVKSSTAEAIKAALAEAPAVNAGGITTKSAPAVTKDARHSASFAKALGAWMRGDTPAGFAHGTDLVMYPESKKGAWEGGTDNEGGYAVPDDFYNSIVQQRDYASWVRQAPVMRLTTTRDRILVPTEATASTKMVIVDEEAAYDENEPVFGQVALTIYKATKLIKVSEELMNGDAVGLEAYMASTIARANALAENYYCTIGSGTGMPQGVLTGATASGITTASATAVTAAELTQAIGTLDGVWQGQGTGILINHATNWYLRGLTGNPFQFVATPQGGDFHGLPAYISPDMEGIASTKKSVLVGHFPMYAFAERQGLVIQRNPYLYMANGIVGVFASARFGGAVLQTTAFKYLTQKS